MLIPKGTSPRAYAQSHGEQAVRKFPDEAGIIRYGKPEEIAGLLGYLVSPAAPLSVRRPPELWGERRSWNVGCFSAL